MVGTYRHLGGQELGEWTQVFGCRKEYLAERKMKGKRERKEKDAHAV
jgi:hypothetical protein